MEAEKEEPGIAVKTGEKTEPSDTSLKETEVNEKKRQAEEGEESPAEKKMKVDEQTTADMMALDDTKEKEERETKEKDNIKKIQNGEENKTGVDSDDETLSLKKKKQVNGESKDDSDMSVNSEDSEKENMNSDLPMDLSTKSSTPSNTQDVIMLSDESDEEMSKNSRVGRRDLTLDDLKLKRKMIKRLQAELRNEEAKLVLLKKLRQSQTSNQISDNNLANKSQRPPQHSQPPPLIRGNQPQQHQMQARPAHSQPPQLVRGNLVQGATIKGAQGPPPLLPSRVQDQRQLMQNQMQMLQRGSSPANIIPGLRGSQAQAEALRQMQQVQRVVEETPAQRQAAAKLALRKQLEKTLLQIPPPKPPPPEMNFIPSLASPDFIYLLGLEEAVNFIIDSNLISKGAKSPDEKLICNPFTCVQCGLDFTPVWKREKPGSKNVICEKCVTTNQKKALKQEHTNRLKSAFVKALQQEQEIERMQSQETKSTTPTPVTTGAQSQHREGRESRDSPSGRNNQSSANYKEVAETLRQHQNLLQAQAASLRMGQPLGLQAFNPRFPYQIPFARASELARATDMQRQYLLDMIPKGGMPWSS